MVHTASGAKGQRFESSRAYQNLEVNQQDSATCKKSLQVQIPRETEILDDSDSQLTRGSKRPEVCA